MRMKLVALLLAAPLLATPASGADLRERGPHGWQERGRYGGPSYGELWRHPGPPPSDSFRPTRRVMGGPDYMGSDYGLAKPSFYGIARRPDWGRSSYD